MSGVDEEYGRLFFLESWDHPVQSVNHMIEMQRKVNKARLGFHSESNHKYHMDRWGRCVYCDNGIPIASDDELQKKKEHKL